MAALTEALNEALTEALNEALIEAPLPADKRTAAVPGNLLYGIRPGPGISPVSAEQVWSYSSGPRLVDEIKTGHNQGALDWLAEQMPEKADQPTDPCFWRVVEAVYTEALAEQAADYQEQVQQLSRILKVPLATSAFSTVYHEALDYGLAACHKDPRVVYYWWTGCSPEISAQLDWVPFVMARLAPYLPDDQVGWRQLLGEERWQRFSSAVGAAMSCIEQLSEDDRQGLIDCALNRSGPVDFEALCGRLAYTVQRLGRR